MERKPAMNVPTFADRAHAPIIFFDAVPINGFRGGIATLTLMARASIPDGGGHIDESVFAVAHLRCNLETLTHLKKAIENVELMAAPATSKTQ